MTATLNKTTLIGYLGQDPEVRGSGDKEVLVLSLATSENWMNKEMGEVIEKTYWHQIVVFNKNLIELVKKYLVKRMRLSEVSTRKLSKKN